MKKNTLLAFCCLLFINIYAADFSSKQQAIIYNEAISTIHQYQDLLNKMADQIIDIGEFNKTGEKIIELFVARKVLIYNDLDPSHTLSEFYELDTYVANLQLWYPDGLRVKIDFDNLKAGNLAAHNENIYTIDILASKKLNGNYINKTTNNNNEELLFRLAFFKDGAGFKGFKIAGIRSTKSKQQNDSKILAEVKGQNIDEKDMPKIKTQISGLINDYVNFLNLLVDQKESPEDKEFYKTSFLNLFTNSKVNLINDIEPKPEKRWLNTTEYIENYIQAFPEGIRNLSVNIDSAKYGKIIPVENDKFSISVNTEKFFSGKYKDKTIMRENAKLNIKISFEKNENTFKNFRFEEIDRNEMNIDEQPESQKTAELPKITVSTIKRNGFQLGVNVSYAFINYTDPNVLDNNDILKWKSSTTGEITPSLILKYFPFNKLGIETGFSFDEYNADLALNGLYTSKTKNNDDIIGNEYYQQIGAYKYDSALSYSYLRIPLSLIVYSNPKPEKFGFYVKAGLAFSFLLKSKYTTTADSLTNPRIYDIPSYISDQSIREKFYAVSMNDGSNYYFKRYLSNSGTLEANKLGVSLIASFGVVVPLGYFSSFEIGPEIIYQMSNTYKGDNYVDMLENISSAKKVHFIKYGLKIGFTYKL